MALNMPPLGLDCYYAATVTPRFTPGHLYFPWFEAQSVSWSAVWITVPVQPPYQLLPRSKDRGLEAHKASNSAHPATGKHIP
ncbi:hypothetical protein JCM33374_g4920 [Metschnikowia sp. JCM 33374]|nr:hypothetical protein JCM33374_g4920 [Metschnikowia sp. JCM 33374]